MIPQVSKELLDALLADPAGRRIGVLGLGISGRAMALYLARRQAHVVGVDTRADILEHELLVRQGIELRLGSTPADILHDVEAIAISPGIDPRQPCVATALERNIPVFGELELVASSLTARTVAITGTNGKSTTTSLVGHLVESCKVRTFVGGNLGDPVVGFVDRNTPVDVAVLELSSFQLEAVWRMRFDVAIVMNVTPDHMDRYPDIETYALAKQRAVELLKPTGIAILNYDDAHVRAMAAHAPGQVWWFSTRSQTLPGDGAVLVGDELVPQGALQDFGRISLRHERLLGRHNRENALAAFLAVRALGLVKQADALWGGYHSFRGLEHRLELAGHFNGVRYINDSKATNDASAAIGLLAMEHPVVLLAGGKDKGGGYAELVAAARGRVKAVVAFGAARHLISQAFGNHVPVYVCEHMLEACALSKNLAVAGDVVLLSPACSSFDEFRDYTHRGRVFKEWVSALEGAA